MDKQSNSAAATAHSGGQRLETSKAKRAVWLMKCPPVVSRSLQCPPPSSEFAFLFDSSRLIDKVVISIDPLCSNDQSSSQQFLKDLLKDLCLQQGISQGSYELKPKYKKSADEPGSV
ncbi:uncharacterized protein LOC130775496 isoform X1 [Actinidia eriantha]|uniref:uncharacterized protein LOC130775496 isoform X1 n=1 Tax=Actinidia eriantha TaxID=165200 RepID=UPI0025880EC0|nr:uncharacterized protein LOC130775496 isoform X1 [Actinidia eriantha]